MTLRPSSIVLSTIIASAPALAEASTPLAIFSRLHMPMLHFPIALLVIAFVLELLLRKKGDGHRLAVGTLLALAAAAAVVAVASGLALATVEDTEGTLVDQHQILGIVTAIIAVLSALAYRRIAGLLRTLSLPLMGVAAFGVVVAGHLGGKLVHGADYYEKAFSSAAKTTVAVEASGRGTADDGGEDEAARARNPEGAIPDKPDYLTHIKPLMQRSCVKCHGPEKRKGGLRLDEKRFAMKGGESGVSIVAGDAAKSRVYTWSALPADDEDVMPEKGKLLALSEIETLKRWIEQGAVWPDEAAGP